MNTLKIKEEYMKIISQVRRQGIGVCKKNSAGDPLSHFPCPFLVNVASNLKEESHPQNLESSSTLSSL